MREIQPLQGLHEYLQKNVSLKTTLHPKVHIEWICMFLKQCSQDFKHKNSNMSTIVRVINSLRVTFFMELFWGYINLYFKALNILTLNNSKLFIRSVQFWYKSSYLKCFIKGKIRFLNDSNPLLIALKTSLKVIVKKF